MNRRSLVRLNSEMTCRSCLVVRSDSGNKTGSPDSVVSFNVSVASGFEFSEATTTAPVHATMPGSFVMATDGFPLRCSLFVPTCVPGGKQAPIGLRHQIRLGEGRGGRHAPGVFEAAMGRQSSILRAVTGPGLVVHHHGRRRGQTSLGEQASRPVGTDG
jgi:hypothetical protein